MSQYGGERADVWHERWLTARKSHRCHACGELIIAGHRYHLTKNLSDGEGYTIRRCARCQMIYAHLTTRIRKDGDRDEYCHETLDCGDSYQERWGEEPPLEIAALAFALPGETPGA